MFLSGMLARGRTRVKTRSLAANVRWALAAGWMGLIFYLSHQTAPLGARPSAFESTLAHLALYGALALLLSWALATAGGGRSGPAWALATVVFGLTVLYGVTDELHQAFVPGRQASQSDLAIDAAGAGLGIAAWLLWARLVEAVRARSSPN